MVFEGAVVGDGTVVGEDAIIQAGVKIWPNKEVENGATVSHSIIWGSQGRRVLFGRYGVTGVVNVDLTPDFVARLGAAFGSILPKGSTVTINRDPHRSPRMIKRALDLGPALGGQQRPGSARCCPFPSPATSRGPAARPAASMCAFRPTTNGWLTSASSAAMA